MLGDEQLLPAAGLHVQVAVVDEQQLQEVLGQLGGPGHEVPHPQRLWERCGVMGVPFQPPPPHPAPPYPRHCCVGRARKRCGFVGSGRRRQQSGEDEDGGAAGRCHDCRGERSERSCRADGRMDAAPSAVCLCSPTESSCALRGCVTQCTFRGSGRGEGSPAQHCE